MYKKVPACYQADCSHDATNWPRDGRGRNVHFVCERRVGEKKRLISNTLELNINKYTGKWPQKTSLFRFRFVFFTDTLLWLQVMILSTCHSIPHWVVIFSGLGSYLTQQTWQNNYIKLNNSSTCKNYYVLLCFFFFSFSVQSQVHFSSLPVGHSLPH